MGFGPRALRFEGVWHSNPEDGWPEIAAQKLDTVTSEVKLAQYRQKLTISWMLDNPRDVVALMWLHVSQELTPGQSSTRNWLLPLAGRGGARAVQIACRMDRRLSVVCANVLSIAMTYSAHGRFMVPMQPLLVALSLGWTVNRGSSGPDAGTSGVRGKPPRIRLMIEEQR
jgi:hypothetical protein